MIVCNRCGFENPDGRNLCSRCRAYLGWVRAGGSVAVDPLTDDTAAPAPTTEAAPAGPPKPRPAPVVGASSVTSTQLWPPSPSVAPVEHRPLPVQPPRQPPALPDVTPRSAPAPIPLPPPVRPDPSWSAPIPTSVGPPQPPWDATTSGPSAPVDAPPSAAGPTPVAPRAAPTPVAPNPWDVPAGTGSGPSNESGLPPAPDARREVISPGPTTPRQVTTFQLNAIPTTIAETPSRYAPTVPRMPGSAEEGSGDQPFTAVRPDDRRRSTAGTGGPTGGAADPSASGLAAADLDAEGQRCPQCGRAVPAGRRFCRCGATLIAPTVDEGWDEAPERLPWWQRMQDAVNGAAKFRRTMRMANGGLRVPFSAPRAVRQRVMQMAFALGLSAVVVSQLGSWGTDLRRQAWATVSAVLPWSYTTMEVKTAAVDPAADPTAGFAPENAVDRNTGTAWATTWTSVAADPTAVDPTSSSASALAGTPCARPSGAALLVVGFDAPVAVDRVTVYPGMPAGSGTRDVQNRPKTIDLRLSDGTCRELSVPDVSAEVSVDITGRDITSITLAVVDVYPGDPTSDAGTLVAITEVVPAHR
jgi:hypothetical protein